MLRNLASQARMAVSGNKEPPSPTSPQAAAPSPLNVPQVCGAVSCSVGGEREYQRVGQR